MKTMSHTPEQRKAWHEGKQKKGETKSEWFRRVVASRNPNFLGAKQIKSINYSPLEG